MNKNRETLSGNYNYSIRTSGEVGGVFIRTIEVIFKLVLFIESKITINFAILHWFCIL